MIDRAILTSSSAETEEVPRSNMTPGMSQSADAPFSASQQQWLMSQFEMLMKRIDESSTAHTTAGPTRDADNFVPQPEMGKKFPSQDARNYNAAEVPLQPAHLEPFSTG